jgi:hypothetical protein
MTTAPAIPDAPFSRPRHQGTGYLKLLRRLHALKRPRSYLKIGTAAGKTLAIARSPASRSTRGFGCNAIYARAKRGASRRAPCSR